MAKPESNFWSQVKKNLKQFQWVRLESWAGQGVPDLLGTTSAGKFFTVELKVSKSKKVKLSPHQIAFHKSRPESPSFILVKTLGESTPKKSQMFLVPSSHVDDLLANGVSLPFMIKDWEDLGQRINDLAS